MLVIRLAAGGSMTQHYDAGKVLTRFRQEEVGVSKPVGVSVPNPLSLTPWPYIRLESMFSFWTQITTPK